MINIFKNTARKLKTGLLIMIMCLGFIFSASAQDSKGTEFWICFPGNNSSTNTELYITAEAASSVTISIPGLAFNTVVAVPAGGLQTVSIPAAAQVQSSFIAESKGIHITATTEVTVYGMNAQTATTDAFLGFPTDAIGSSYYVMGYNRDFSFSLPTQATILATQNATTVTVTASVTSGPFTAGVPTNIVLQEGQVYQLRSLVTNADYTGTRITSDKPISVFGGAQCTNISGVLRACDHLVEQLPPLSSWGKSFATVPLATRTGGDVFRLMAQTNGTAVSVNGVVVANLNAGQFFETILGSATYNRISSNLPILVGQYSRSSEADGVTSDPFFALVPPDEQFLNAYTISAGTANIPNNWVNITSPTANTGTVKVDGVTVAAGLWNPIPATTFSGAKVPVTVGVHRITSSLPIGALVYGFGSFDSYGYLGGQSFSPVALVSTAEITPETGTSEVCNNRCWSVVVKDQFGTPVAGVRVDFVVTGANPQSSFSNTNASGIATYCYTGLNVGADNITATIGSVSDAATFNWTALSLTLTAGSNSPVAVGGTINLTASAGFSSYSWKDPNGVAFSTDQNPSIANATLAMSGIYTVTGTTSGGCTVTGTVTVSVVEANNITCPADISENIGTSCTKSIATSNPVFNGTLTNLTWTLTGATTGSSAAIGIFYVGTKTFKAGTTTVTYVATDNSGGVSTCSFTVKLTENVPPEIRCPADKALAADPGVCTRAVVSLGTPIASDNCGLASVTNNAPAIYQPGTNYVTWTATDKSGNIRTCVQEITIIDNQRPTITCPPSVLVNTGADCNATPVTLPHPVFADNCGVVTLKWAMVGVTWGSSDGTGINYVPTMNYATGVSTITYTAIDAAGNQTSCTFKVTVKDVTPPTLICPPAQTFCKVWNNTYTIPLLIQSDNCVIATTECRITGATNRSGYATDASGIFNVGVSTIKWTVKDVNGNVSTCTTTVTILPVSNPDCTVPAAPITFANQRANETLSAEAISGLSIVSFPNPTRDYFNLKVNTAAKEVVEIRLLDTKGILVQAKRGAPGDIYRLGENVVSGMYIIEVTQAGKTVRTKVVKQ
jgi:IgGFc binding protein/Bacterial Ig-like domain (group 1)/HYR domain/Secretion system C-terminal sorting domain